MLLMICIVAGVIFSGAMIWFGEEWGWGSKHDDFWEAVKGAGIALIVVCLLSFLIAGFWIFGEHIGWRGDEAAAQQKYESLTYQLENDIYDNDNDIGKKELMDQVEKWNTDLARHQTLNQSPWLNWFHANYYDNLKFIELGD